MVGAEYRQKCVSADEAVKAIRSGDWIEFGFAVNRPKIIDQALARRKEELFNVKLRGGLLLEPLAALENDPQGQHFTWHPYHCSGLDRQYIKKGLASHITMRFSELPRYIKENLTTDVVCIQVAPPDEQGYMNFGVTFTHFLIAMEKARTVIVEVNEDLPRVINGEGVGVHISQVDYIVEGGHLGVPELAATEPSPLNQKIAEYVMPYIGNGACIQLGIGGVPNALGKMIAQSDLTDLGIHSEMLVDSVVDLAEAGKLSGKHKKMDQGKIVFTFAGGSKRLYEFMNENPALAAYPVDYVNHPLNAAKQDNLISINAGLEIDFAGQVCSESIGPATFSGAGGQLDFALAAYYANNGKSFLCIPSTYKDKEGKLQSRIKPMLTEGAIITTPRNSVQYFVTEYGIVNLKGLDTWQRTEKIISLAHPEFRESLIEIAEKMRIWRPSAKL